MKRKHLLIGVGGLILVGLFWGFWRSPEVQVRAKFFLDPKIHPAIKRDAIKLEAKRLMKPLQQRERAEKSEAERLARWKANFPFKPTHDPMVKFDPKRPYLFTTGYAPDELSEEELKLFKEASKNRSNADLAIPMNHSRLKSFFEDEMRFSRQFEQFYNILKEHDRGHDPAQIAGAFYAFRRYYHAAIEHEPDEYLIENGKKVRKNLLSYVTWGDVAEEEHESMRGYLRSWEWLRDPHFATKAGEAEANGLIGRLVEEMEGMEELPLDVWNRRGGSMVYSSHNKFISGLMSGEEELLVPYVGWFEKAREYCLEQELFFDMSYALGDPSLKKVAPELFPPVNIKGNRLVDKDGDFIKPYEGMDLHLRDSSGEKFPLTIDEEGFLTIPSPAEIEAMREMSKDDFQDSE